MARLIIKNIGPIKEVDIELNKINVFIGPQSSGKSTISKILCHCQWVEKTCYLDDEELKRYEKGAEFYESLVEYHRLKRYFNKTASIKYIGEYLTITYTHSSRKIILKKIKNSEYNYPKISYIPAERNLVAAISNLGRYNEGNDVILYFGYDWTDAKDAISQINLSKILERNISYESRSGVDYIKDGKAEILLKFASSGILSLLPLYLTVSYMCDTVYKKERPISARKRMKLNQFSKEILNFRNEFAHNIESNVDSFILKTDSLLESIAGSYFVNEITEIRKMYKKDVDYNLLANAVNQLSIKIEEGFNYKYTQLFIEEPEQNLFPKAQKRFIYELLRLITNSDKNHCAVITTHSPYILYALNNCMMGGLLNDKLSVIKDKIECRDSFIDPKQVNVYGVANGVIFNIQQDDKLIGNNFFEENMKDLMDDFYKMLNFYGNDKK